MEDATFPRKELAMELTKTEVSKIKKYAKELGVENLPKEPADMRLTLLTHINEIPEGECPKEIETWFNTQIELEQEAEKIKEKAAKLSETKEKAKAKKSTPKAGKSSVPKSPYNHRLHTQAGKMDECLLKGSTMEEIEKYAECKKGRVNAHKNHLETAHNVKFETSKTGKIKIVKG